MESSSSSPSLIQFVQNLCEAAKRHFSRSLQSSGKGHASPGAAAACVLRHPSPQSHLPVRMNQLHFRFPPLPSSFRLSPLVLPPGLSPSLSLLGYRGVGPSFSCQRLLHPRTNERSESFSRDPIAEPGHHVCDRDHLAIESRRKFQQGAWWDVPHDRRERVARVFV